MTPRALPLLAFAALAGCPARRAADPVHAPSRAPDVPSRADAPRAAPTVPTAPPGTAMNLPVLPDSPSLLLRAATIVRVRVEAAAPSPWRRDRPGYDARDVDVTFRATAFAKGLPPPDPVAAVRVRQERYATARVADALGGVWSSASLDPGSSWWVLSAAAPGPLAAALAEPACLAVLPEAYGADVELAASTQGNAAAVLAAAAPRAAELHELFVDYVWARFGEHALDDLPSRDALLGTLRWPALPPAARGAAVQRADDLAGHPRADESYRDDLAAALFAAAGEPGPLADAVLGDVLPNLLGLGQHGGLRPHAVFARSPAGRDVARRALASYRGPRDVAALRAWLGAE